MNGSSLDRSFYPMGAGSNPARDKAKGHIDFSSGKYGVGSTLAAKLACLFNRLLCWLFNIPINQSCSTHQATEGCAVDLTSAEKEGQWVGLDEGNRREGKVASFFISFDGL